VIANFISDDAICPVLSCDFQCKKSPSGGFCVCPKGYRVNNVTKRTCDGKFFYLIGAVLCREGIVSNFAGMLLMILQKSTNVRSLATVTNSVTTAGEPTSANVSPTASM